MDREQMRERALAAARSGDYSVAKDLLLQLYLEEPYDADVLFFLGSTLYKLGDLSEAISYWEKAQELNPEDLRIARLLNEAREKRDEESGASPTKQKSWSAAFGTLDDERHTEGDISHSRWFPVMVLGIGLAVAAFAGFLAHFVARFFWMPFVPAIVLGGLAGLIAAIALGPARGFRVSPWVLPAAALLGLLSYGFIFVWDATEFYHWGGAQRMYELQMQVEATGTRDLGAIQAQPPIESPRSLLMTQVGRDDLAGYFTYANRVGRVQTYKRHYSRSESPELRVYRGGMLALFMAAEAVLAAITAGAAARALTRNTAQP